MRMALFILGLSLVFPATSGRAETYEYELRQGFAGYWLVVAAELPDGSDRQRILAKGQCRIRICEVESAAGIYGRLYLTGNEIGPVARFHSEVAGRARVLARYHRRDLLQAFMPYGRQLQIGHKASDREGGLVWVLVKKPDNPRFRRALWRYVEKARFNGRGVIIRIP